MKIGGLVPFSSIDFPGHLACVVFTQGCPFRCHFCHNPELVLPERFGPQQDEEQFLAFLARRRDKLDGVVISGGEPTLQLDLEPFVQKIRGEGFHVKLDTNGINPVVLKKLLDQRLLDYVAMDIKAPFRKYESVIGTSCDMERIKESATLLLENKVPYEFRTTFVRPFHEIGDLLEIAEAIKGARLYVVQQFRREKILGDFQEGEPMREQEFLAIKPQLERFVERSFLR